MTLSQGKFAAVDWSDLHIVASKKWHTTADGYAATGTRKQTGERSILRMHRLIMDAKAGQTVDHIDFDTINNRRTNLRFVSASQNMQHTRGWANRKYSKFKGVTRHVCSKCNGMHKKKWTAQITVNRKLYNLGAFEFEEDAAKAYDAAAKSNYGEYAYLNFPDVTE